jgi:hypothetical protein
MFCYHCFLCNKTLKEGDNSCRRLFCSDTNKNKKGDGSKIIAVIFFT